MMDVAELIGLQCHMYSGLLSKWPQCIIISCIDIKPEGKSKRQALTGQTEMLHETPRPG